MKRTLELCAGNYGWLKLLPNGKGEQLLGDDAASWEELQARLLAARNAFIAGEWAAKEFMFGPSMAHGHSNDVSNTVQQRCATLPWGDDE